MDIEPFEQLVEAMAKIAVTRPPTDAEREIMIIALGLIRAHYGEAAEHE